MATCQLYRILTTTAYWLIELNSGDITCLPTMTIADDDEKEEKMESTNQYSAILSLWALLFGCPVIFALIS